MRRVRFVIEIERGYVHLGCVLRQHVNVRPNSVHRVMGVQISLNGQGIDAGDALHGGINAGAAGDFFDFLLANLDDSAIVNRRFSIFLFGV